jgi:hypothetical protein
MDHDQSAGMIRGRKSLTEKILILSHEPTTQCFSEEGPNVFVEYPEYRTAAAAGAPVVQVCLYSRNPVQYLNAICNVPQDIHPAT